MAGSFVFATFPRKRPRISFLFGVCRNCRGTFPAHRSNPSCNAYKRLSNAMELTVGIFPPPQNGHRFQLIICFFMFRNGYNSKTPQQSSKSRICNRSRAQRQLTLVQAKVADRSSGSHLLLGHSSRCTPSTFSTKFPNPHEGPISVDANAYR